ncbi:uncharacterized protein [Onthophagus taurus]|uniref:uncharacterized protein n=1 Tax=Onthophagus taurus TaxID=166361 RepID=UPI0039BDE912
MKMDEIIDIEKLIVEIQNRPALWDMKTKEYSDRVKRNECWEELVNVFADQNMTIDAKKQLGKFKYLFIITNSDDRNFLSIFILFILGELIRKKWKNIRDRFARELQERKGKSGDGARTKAPYVYTKHLQFLKDILTPKQTINSLEQISNTEPIISEQEPGQNGRDLGRKDCILLRTN